MQKTQGIYKITNLINNKCYIGQSRNIESRIKKHFSNLEKNIHHSQYLQEDFNKYGKENFSIEILETINDLDLLLIVEDFYIKKFHAYGCGYNMIPSKLEKENTYGLNMSISKIEEILQQSDYIIFNDTLLKDIKSGIIGTTLTNGITPLLEYLLFLKQFFPELKGEISYTTNSKDKKVIGVRIEYKNNESIFYSLGKNIRLYTTGYSPEILHSNDNTIKRIANKKTINVQQRIKFWE